MLLVHPERSLLIFAEIKAAKGVITPAQERWLGWLGQIQVVAPKVWRPAMEEQIRALLLGGGAMTTGRCLGCGQVDSPPHAGVGT